MRIKNFSVKLIFLIASLFTLSTAQPLSKQDSIWLLMKYFVGNWKGTGGGQPGEGTYERSYQFIFNNNYIQVKNTSTYPPSGKNPRGEVHEDIGYISYDKARKKFVLRQFHVEGFVNQYTLDSISTDSKTLVFVSESIENIPAGWRAKETYRIVSDNEFTETFELAPPGKEFSVYSTAVLKRVR